MKKHLISALLIGAMVVPAFVACDNKGLDDLTRRVEVLEGAWHQTQKDLQNQSPARRGRVRQPS